MYSWIILTPTFWIPALPPGTFVPQQGTWMTFYVYSEVFIYLLETLQDYHPSMTFSIEIGGQKLWYLDLSIFQTEHNNVFETAFGVYCESTFLGGSIAEESYPPHFMNTPPSIPPSTVSSDFL